MSFLLEPFALPPAGRLSKAAFWIFALTVALLPLGLGGNRPVPLGLAQLALGLSAFLAVLDRDLWTGRLVPGRVLVALALLGLSLVWAVLQTLPFAPEAAAYPLWKEAEGVLGLATGRSIAVSPEDALDGLQRLFTYVATGCLGFVLMRDTARAKVLLVTLFASSAVYALYGLAIYAIGNPWILWFNKWAYTDDLTSVFVNRNHFAIHTVLGLVCGSALLLRGLSRGLRLSSPSEKTLALRAWAARRLFPMLGVMALMFLAILLSHSRSGLMLALFSLGGIGCAFLVYKRQYFMALMVVALAVIAIGSAFTIARSTSERFMNLKQDHSLLDRHYAYRLMADAIQDNPWLGYGLNGFQTVWRAREQGMVMEFNRGHSDVLEALLDLGVPVGLMLWGAVLILVSGVARGVRRRHRNGIYPCVGLIASLTVLLHACMDFSLQIPGVAMAWVALLGMGLAHSWSPRLESAKGYTPSP